MNDKLKLKQWKAELQQMKDEKRKQKKQRKAANKGKKLGADIKELMGTNRSTYYKSNGAWRQKNKDNK